MELVIIIVLTVIYLIIFPIIALGGYVMLATENRGFSDVFDKFEFIDGTPFGIKEE